MNRLNMHVISNDFHSCSMRRIQHWNTFNSELFITYQAIYALLHVKGSVEPMPAEKVEQLLHATPVHCNQCTFYTENFGQFKRHLYLHWRDREIERLRKLDEPNISEQMRLMQINGNGFTMRKPQLNPFYRQPVPMHNKQFVPRFQRPIRPQFDQNRNLNIRPSYGHQAPPKPPSNNLQNTQADAQQSVDQKLPQKKKWHANKKRNSQSSSSNPKGRGGNPNNPKGGANAKLI